MALISCPECNYYPVSKKAAFCPHCGSPDVKCFEGREIEIRSLDPSTGTNEFERLKGQGWEEVDRRTQYFEGNMSYDPDYHVTYIKLRKRL